MNEDELILNAEQLEKMGIHGETIFTIEYDMPAKRKIPKHASDEEKRRIKAKNRLIQRFRNKLIYMLKFRIKATMHLQSSWIIDKSRLENAITELQSLREEMAERGFDTTKRVRILPILTTTEGFEHYEEQKAQFLLNLAMEHIQYIDKGLDEQRFANSSLWRCQKAYGIIEVLKEELKQKTDLYNEITDTVALLGDKMSEMEEQMAEWKAEEEEE